MLTTRACRRFEREHGNVVVRLSTDPAREPLRQFLVATVHSCQELWDLCCRLGLPRTSALTKAPFSLCALPPLPASAPCRHRSPTGRCSWLRRLRQAYAEPRCWDTKARSV